MSTGSAGAQPQAVSGNPKPGMSTDNADTHFQTGRTNPFSAGRSAGRGGTHFQAGQGLSLNKGASDTTAGEVTSSPDNTAGVIWEQGPGPRRQVPQLPPQYTKPRSSRGFPPGRGKQSG